MINGFFGVMLKIGNVDRVYKRLEGNKFQFIEVLSKRG